MVKAGKLKKEKGIRQYVASPQKAGVGGSNLSSRSPLDASAGGAYSGFRNSRRRERSWSGHPKAYDG